MIPQEAFEAPPSSRMFDGTVCAGSAPRDASLVLRLRSVIARTLHEATLEGCARDLGLSARTLQRRLQAAGTSFQEQVCRARVRAAKQRILSGEGRLTDIAFQVGCASPQHLSVLFRAHAGMPPSAWRARKTRGPAQGKGQSR